MLLAACFGSVGKMQTMDTICNHGGNYVDVLLRQFGVGVQKPGKTVHYKNQDGTDIFILGRLDIVTFDFFQNGIPQMLRKAVHRGYRNHTEVIRCLLAPRILSQTSWTVCRSISAVSASSVS